MKTYSRKMSSPGTTSSLPSTPSFPTSSTPANEDRTKAENRVVVDDTPISTAENVSSHLTRGITFDLTPSKFEICFFSGR